MAEVHAASALAGEMIALTATDVSGPNSLAAEIAYAENVAAAGLGEIMGWGQDRFEDLDDRTVATIVTRFQEAFRLMEEAFESGDMDRERLLAVTGQLAGHFAAIRDAVRTPPGVPGTPARRLLEAHEMAKLLGHHFEELPGSPIVTDSRLAVRIALRTLDRGTGLLVKGLEPLPERMERARPHLSQLRAILTNPPDCAIGSQPDRACVERLCASPGPPLHEVVAITR